jgi:hypothetical protein
MITRLRNTKTKETLHDGLLTDCVEVVEERTYLFGFIRLKRMSSSDHVEREAYESRPAPGRMGYHKIATSETKQ